MSDMKKAFSEGDFTMKVGDVLRNGSILWRVAAIDIQLPGLEGMVELENLTPTPNGESGDAGWHRRMWAAPSVCAAIAFTGNKMSHPKEET